MKAFALYTAARFGLFVVAYGLIWLIFGQWIEWDSISALYTALIAMLISSAIALVVLRPLRSQLSAQVSERAERVKQAYETRRAAEDDD